MRRNILIVTGLMAVVVLLGTIFIREACMRAVISRELSYLKELGCAITVCQQEHSGFYAQSLNAPELQSYLNPNLLQFITEGRISYFQPTKSASRDFAILVLTTPRGEWVCTKDLSLKPHKKPL